MLLGKSLQFSWTGQRNCRFIRFARIVCVSGRGKSHNLLENRMNEPNSNPPKLSNRGLCDEQLLVGCWSCSFPWDCIAT